MESGIRGVQKISTSGKGETELKLDTISVLDHGYLKFIESWGSDERIIESARMSTGKGFLGWGPILCDGECRGFAATPEPGYERCSKCKGSGILSGDEKLLAYLYSHRHSTPFEMAGCIIEVQAPIFVFREWRTHRTCTQVDDEMFWDDAYNEMSARYVPLPDLNYIPTVERLLTNSKTNKQAGTARDANELTEAMALEYQTLLGEIYEEQEGLYQHALRSGVPKELARVHLPVGRYSRMRASANLRNWLAFLTLRMAPNAQFEIQEYARGVGKFISELFPRTWGLFAKEQVQ